MTRGKLHTRSTFSGAPRRHQVVCAADCGWRGMRSADTPEELSNGPRCPNCGAVVVARIARI